MFNLRSLTKKWLPAPLVSALRVLRDLSKALARKEDRRASLAFLRQPCPNASFLQRLVLIGRIYWISACIQSPHTQKEILTFVKTILTLPSICSGVVLEAGCFKGSSTAKFSLAAALAGRRLVVVDSFEGIPANRENHGKNIFGGEAVFDEGDYCGTLDEVKNNVRRYGDISVCSFIKGWLEDTLPNFRDPVAAAYIDVDLASSTRTCLKYLYPIVQNGGVLFSQDGHLPLVIDVLEDEKFWLYEVGYPKPEIEGLGIAKLVKISKR